MDNEHILPPREWLKKTMEELNMIEKSIDLLYHHGFLESSQLDDLRRKHTAHVQDHIRMRKEAFISSKQTKKG